ncbi:hypothetical protein ABW20_dc0109843 [Dactylellina cionopaga]|nr:hypothetical protein ABW20_dc0109843 [Dactylellina cionopaga]
MSYYDGEKLYKDFAQNPAIQPMWQSSNKWLTLYALPIEWQIQTKMVRMSMWYRQGLVYDEKYLRELQHVLGLLWEFADKGRDKLDILNVGSWLPEYLNPAQKFGRVTWA